jgi:hypothetical protein
VRDIRDQCRKADVAFFFKQWGGFRKKQAGRRLDGKTYDAFPDYAMVQSLDGEHRLLLLREVETEFLRERYLAKARGLVLHALESKHRLLYDDAWITALSEPMSWESDLKQWIEEWKDEGKLSVFGMKPHQRVPHRGEQNYLILK